MRFLIKMVRAFLFQMVHPGGVGGWGGFDGGVDGGRGVGGWAGANVMEGNAAVNCAEQ